MVPDSTLGFGFGRILGFRGHCLCLRVRYLGHIRVHVHTVPDVFGCGTGVLGLGSVQPVDTAAGVGTAAAVAEVGTAAVVAQC